ncbi:MAG: ATP-binding protein [bacterium]
MVISVASGKGGTGKTTIAASLASVIPDSVYVDCDVEEPNGHLLLKPKFISEESVDKFLPMIDQEKCTFCSKCVEVCEFNALINLKFEIVLFDEMCHGCGACQYFCPSKIITGIVKEIGVVRFGITNDNILFVDGLLNIGEVAAAPLIKEVKKKIIAERINILDSPPGTSCSMVETIKDSDFCILVTESTPFGLNDLKLAIEVLIAVGVSFGVVINKYDSSFLEMENYLNCNSIEILLKIPFDRRYAESYSEGKLPLINYPSLRENFIALYKNIIKKARNANAG